VSRAHAPRHLQQRVLVGELALRVALQRLVDLAEGRARVIIGSFDSCRSRAFLRLVALGRFDSCRTRLFLTLVTLGRCPRRTSGASRVPPMISQTLVAQQMLRLSLVGCTETVWC
jgi:hypothetical protein